jgi:hypothetical protein
MLQKQITATLTASSRRVADHRHFGEPQGGAKTASNVTATSAAPAGPPPPDGVARPVDHHLLLDAQCIWMRSMPTPHHRQAGDADDRQDAQVARQARPHVTPTRITASGNRHRTPNSSTR